MIDDLRLGFAMAIDRAEIMFMLKMFDIYKIGIMILLLFYLRGKKNYKYASTCLTYHLPSSCFFRSEILKVF